MLIVTTTTMTTTKLGVVFLFPRVAAKDPTIWVYDRATIFTFIPLLPLVAEIPSLRRSPHRTIGDTGGSSRRASLLFKML